VIAEPLRDLAVPLDQLRMLKGNPRRGDVAAVKRSLERFGQRKPVVARADGTVIAGNHMLAAARELGWPELAVTRVDDDDATAKAFALADNRTAELGSFDLGDLAAMAADVFAVDPGLLEAASYSEADLNALLAGVEVPAKLTDADAVPEPPVEPVSRPGDLWLLGPHRLLCGDATKRDEVARVLDGVRPDLLVTDPPYGVAVGSAGTKTSRLSISGDLTQAAIPLAFAVAVEALADDARLYLFGGSSNVTMYAGLFDHYLRQQVHLIVWMKENFVLRPNLYHSRFELVYFGWKGNGGAAEHWYGDRKQVDLWEVARDRDGLHPTQKPVEVCSIPIRNSCPPGGAVLDPFAGSGSTLIAAHGLGRTCYALELEPATADVACRRWQEHAGIKPVLEATGGPHDFTG
jgi:ParB-like chromosome segregation protein Spo0J